MKSNGAANAAPLLFVLENAHDYHQTVTPAYYNFYPVIEFPCFKFEMFAKPILGGKMTQIFSEQWMIELKEKWNTDPQVHIPLQKAAFTARIGYGFKGEPCARGLLIIVNGKVQYAGAANDMDLDWDLRASQENWKEWIESGFGLSKLGVAVSNRSLEFAKGNYRQMITDLSLSMPFMKHFQLMSKINFC